MNKIIEKAVAGGWKTGEDYKKLEDTVLKRAFELTALLDREFWQSLGKTMGWGKGRPGLLIYEWLYQWHRFVDHLAAGKSTDSFFEELLSSPLSEEEGRKE